MRTAPIRLRIGRLQGLGRGHSCRYRESGTIRLGRAGCSPIRIDIFMPSHISYRIPSSISILSVSFSISLYILREYSRKIKLYIRISQKCYHMTKMSYSRSSPPRHSRREPEPNAARYGNGKIEGGNRTRIFMRNEKRRAAHPIRWTARLTIRLYIPAFAVSSRYRLPAAAS